LCIFKIWRAWAIQKGIVEVDNSKKNSGKFKRSIVGDLKVGNSKGVVGYSKRSSEGNSKGSSGKFKREFSG